MKENVEAGVNKNPLAWYFHARQFQNWSDWIDSFKISYVLQTVSEFVTVEDSFGTNLIWLVQISLANVARNIFTKLVLERYSNGSKNIEIRYLQRISKFPIDSFQIFCLSMPDCFKIPPEYMLDSFRFFGQIFTPCWRDFFFGLEHWTHFLHVMPLRNGPHPLYWPFLKRLKDSQVLLC